jgi:Protein of unknown function (DUF4058)
MPSPFPGLDPYLEGSLWMTIHTDLAVAIAHQLNHRMSPRYVALTARRYVMDTPEESEVIIGETYPDVAVLTSRPADGRGAVAQAIAPPLQMTTLVRMRVPHITVTIRDVAKRHLVTAIEVLSPTNKKGEGFREYRNRREKIMRTTAHLIEIDLLRRGRRVPMREQLPATPYFAFIGRSERRPATDVWPIALDRRLPELPVPLLAGDPDVMLDLQLALAGVYDDDRLGSLIDYTKPPEIPFTPEQAAWVDQHLRAAGLRP